MAQIGTMKGYAAGAKEAYKRAAVNAKDAKGKKGYNKKMSSETSKKYEAIGDRKMRTAKRKFDRRLTQSMQRTTR